MTSDQRPYPPAQQLGFEILNIDPDNIARDLSTATARGLLAQGYVPGPAFLWQEKKDADPRILLVLYAPLQPAPQAQPADLIRPLIRTVWGALAILVGAQALLTALLLLLRGGP